MIESAIRGLFARRQQGVPVKALAQEVGVSPQKLVAEFRKMEQAEVPVLPFAASVTEEKPVAIPVQEDVPVVEAVEVQPEQTATDLPSAVPAATEPQPEPLSQEEQQLMEALVAEQLAATAQPESVVEPAAVETVVEQPAVLKLPKAKKKPKGKGAADMLYEQLGGDRANELGRLWVSGTPLKTLAKLPECGGHGGNTLFALLIRLGYRPGK